MCRKRNVVIVSIHNLFDLHLK